MKKYFLFFTILISSYSDAQINKIDHFFASSPNAEKLFTLFKENLGLPVAWDYKNWGSFASGAVTLGNVAFEFVLFDSLTTTKFDAIALEPRQSVEELIPLLDYKQILHDSIEYNTYKKKDGSTGGWSTLNLKNLLPQEAGIFVCDYKDRKALASAKKRDSTELVKLKGGKIGIISLKEIVVISPNVNNYKMELLKLPGISNNKMDLFSFNSGPSIRMVNSDTPKIEKIVILVHSLASTKKYLASYNLLGKSSKKSIYMNSDSINGLLIEFVDK